MEGYQEKTSSVSVPKNTGVDGFLKTLKGILELPNVQEIKIDSKGSVQYRRYVREGSEDKALAIDYGELTPWNIIRNSELEEVHCSPGTPATNVVSLMFNMVAREGLVPIAFVSGAGSHFWQWHEKTAGVNLARTGSVYGLPFYTDRQIPDHALILCAAYTRGGLVNCHRFIMAGMETMEFIPPETSVSIL